MNMLMIGFLLFISTKDEWMCRRLVAPPSLLSNQECTSAATKRKLLFFDMHQNIVVQTDRVCTGIDNGRDWRRRLISLAQMA